MSNLFFVEVLLVPKLCISLASNYDRHALASKWRELERGPSTSFFTSWHWIGTWLETIPAQIGPLLLKVRLGEELIALGLFCEREERALFGNKVDTLWLHETGRPEIDCLAVEYNGLVTSELDGGASLWPEVLQFFIDQHGADVIRVHGVTKNPEELDLKGTFRAEIQRADLAHHVSLDSIRGASERSLVQVVGSNTRSLLRKSLAKVGGVEAIQVEEASTSEEALEFLRELKELSQKRWNSLDLPGAFDAPFFVQFHQQLISREFELGVISLLKISTAKQLLGYLYNFKYNGDVLNYQCGVNFEDPSLRPGLLCHLAAVDYYAELGLRRYDLLAGDSQYKRSLAQQHCSMYWGSIKRPTLLNSFETQARLLKRRFLKGL